MQNDTFIKELTPIMKISEYTQSFFFQSYCQVLHNIAIQLLQDYVNIIVYFVKYHLVTLVNISHYYPPKL